MPWLSLIILFGLLFLIPTAYAGLIGAPYAPTPLLAIRRAFDMIGVGEDDVVVDLGTGDGKVIIEAAARGARAIGWELSPILWPIAWWRVRRHAGSGRGVVRFGNFYRQQLPHETTVVFAFLMPKRMPRVRFYLARQRLPQARFFLAYAFPLPEVQPLQVVRVEKCAPLYVYAWRDVATHEMSNE